MHYRVESSGRINHHALLRTLSYPALVGGGVVAFYEHSTGLIVALGVAFGLALAVAERIRQLPGCRRSVSAAPSGLPLGDGGSFPGGAPLRRENRTASSAVVIDGGSLEHERRQTPPRRYRHRTTTVGSSQPEACGFCTSTHNKSGRIQDL